MSVHVQTVTSEQFDAAVLEASKETVVVVDFWAPWCGPCRTLGPVLEKAVADAGGRAVLAKVNVDEEPALAQEFGVQGIPAVLAFKDGQIVAEFVGAQPAHVVESWLRQLLPTEGELSREEAERLDREGHADEAIAALESRLEKDESDHAAALQLARLLVGSGDLDRAVALLRAIPDGANEQEGAAEELALVETINAGRTPPAADDASKEARLARAGASWAAGRHAEALDELLELLARDRAYRDGLARRALVAALRHLRGQDELAASARDRLAMILFS